MDLSIIIVNWNTKELLLNCIRSIMEDDFQSQTEIIVVDNASTDDSCEAVENKYPQVKIIKNKTNRGFSAANNQAFGICKGKYICLVNSDIEVLYGCIETLVNFLEKNEKYGIVGPKVLNPDMSYQLSCRKFPSNWNYFIEATGLHKIFRNWHSLSGEYLYLDKDKKKWHNVPSLSGCFLLVRKEVVNSIGGLDERFFFYGEDRDFCIRSSKAGWRTAYLTTARVIHNQGSSSSKVPLRFLKELQYSQLLLWKLHCDKKCHVFLVLRYLYFGIRLIKNYMLYIFAKYYKKRYQENINNIKEMIKWLNINGMAILKNDQISKYEKEIEKL